MPIIVGTDYKSALSGFGFTSKDNIIFQPDGKSCYGVTTVKNSGFLGLGKKIINVYLSQNSFVSRAQLYMTMHHEYMHSYFNYFNINVPKQGHDIIHDWHYDQAQQWGIPANVRTQYFDSGWSAPFNLYSKYGFKIIPNIP